MLWAENVLARRYFYPGCHRMAPRATEQPTAGQRLPATTKRSSSACFQLPTGSAMTPGDVDDVCGIVRLAYEHGEEVRAAVATEGR